VVRRRRRGDEAGGHEPAELAALADGSLPPERRAAVEERVAASPELAALLAEQERAVALARGLAVDVAAPSGLRARIDAQRSRRAPARRLMTVGAAAGVAAAAAAVLVALLVIDSRTSAERFEVALAAVDPASGASGDATLTKTDSGWRIELDATGLPRLDGGRFYQAWLRNDEGVLVTVGTFNEGENVTLWAGVSPVDFPTLTVTREQADGDQASSGDRVLAGTIDTGG
jgi:hypothetical protein